MTYSISSNHSANASLGLFSDNAPKDFNDSSIDGVFPFDFPPPPGGGGMSIGNLFNNIAEIHQLHALQNALHTLVAALFESLASKSVERETSTDRVIDILQPSDTRASLSKWIGSFFTSATPLQAKPALSKGPCFTNLFSLDDLLGTKGIPRGPIERAVYMLPGRMSSEKSDAHAAERHNQQVANNYLHFGFPVTQQTPEATESESNSVPEGAAAAVESKPGRASGEYGFSTELGQRVSSLFLESNPRSRYSSTYEGFELGLSQDSLENSAPQLLERGRQISNFIQTLGRVNDGAEVIEGLAEWLTTDPEIQVELVEFLGFEDEVISTGAHTVRRSMIETMAFDGTKVPEFYAAATQLGIHFGNIELLRYISAAAVKSDNEETLTQLLDLNTLIQSVLPKLKLNPEETEGIKRVVQDLIEKLLISDLVMFYKKAIDDGETPSKSKVFKLLLSKTNFEPALRKLEKLEIKAQRSLELQSKMKQLMATQNKELREAVNTFTAKHEKKKNQEKIDLLRELYKDKQGGEPRSDKQQMSRDQLAQASLQNKESQFEKRREELIEQFEKVHLTQQNDLKSDYQN